MRMPGRRSSEVITDIAREYGKRMDSRFGYLTLAVRSFLTTTHPRGDGALLCTPVQRVVGKRFQISQQHTRVRGHNRVLPRIVNSTRETDGCSTNGQQNEGGCLMPAHIQRNRQRRKHEKENYHERNESWFCSRSWTPPVFRWHLLLYGNRGPDG